MTFSVRETSRRYASVLWQVPAMLALMVLAVCVVGVRAELIGFLYLAAVTPQLCRTDVVERRLPNALVLPGYLVTVTGLTFGWLRSGQFPTTALLAAAGTIIFLFVLSIGGGMGMGDVKLGGGIALNLGVLGAVPAAAGIVIAFVAGGIAGLVALLLPGAGSLRRIPFGPYLLAGLWAATILSVWELPALSF